MSRKTSKVAKVASSSSAEQTLRGVLIMVGQSRLLLPNASVSEVITFSDPEPVDNAPPWLLGRVRWQGWSLPLLSFPKLAGLDQTEGTLGAKVAVLKLLGGNPKLSYFAMLTQGFPRLVTIHADALAASQMQTGDAPGVLHWVELDGEPAMIPDLAAIETLIGQALEQAA